MSPFSDGFTVGWRQGRAYEWIECERTAELQQYRFTGNPPELVKLVKVRVLRPFYLHGKATEVGALVELQRHDALSMQALGKAELVE